MQMSFSIRHSISAVIVEQDWRHDDVTSSNWQFASALQLDAVLYLVAHVGVHLVVVAL